MITTGARGERKCKQKKKQATVKDFKAACLKFDAIGKGRKTSMAPPKAGK